MEIQASSHMEAAHVAKCNPFIAQARIDAARLGLSGSAYQAFRSQFNSARKRGIDFLLTIEQWWNWCQTENLWANRGSNSSTSRKLRLNAW